MKGTCDLRFSLQGRYPSVVDLSAFRITNTAVTIHGSALIAGADITEREFIRTTEAAVQEALTSYLERNSLGPGRNDLIILDMEPRYPDPKDPDKSINFSPVNLGRYEDDPELQAQLILAYARRTIVARNVLLQQWRTVKLGLYGVVVPDGKGEDDPAFDQSMGGYRRAGELGMYDSVDFLVPVLYNRFGPSDVRQPNGDVDMARLHTWIGRATGPAITNTQKLTPRDGQTVPLAPVLTFWVANGNSAHHDKVVSPETMDFQLGLLQEAYGVGIIVLWSGPETREEMRESGREELDFNDFLDQVEGLPPAGCG